MKSFTILVLILKLRKFWQGQKISLHVLISLKGRTQKLKNCQMKELYNQIRNVHEDHRGCSKAG